MKWKIICLVLSLVMALSLTLACAPGEAAPTRVSMGATSAASGYYINEVVLAAILNREVPDIQITVVETGATHDNIRKLVGGILDTAHATYLHEAVRAYTGINPEYKDKPATDLRPILAYSATINYGFVRADSGVENFADLQGKPFHMGIPGSGTEHMAKTAFEAWGIQPDAFVGGWTDAMEALKDGRIVGVMKDSAIGAVFVPAEILEVHTLTPLKTLVPTEEQLDMFVQAYVGLSKNTRAAGEMSLLPEEHRSYGGVLVLIGTSRVPEDIVYKITKASYENWDEYANKARVTKPPFDPLKQLVEGLDVPQTMPLHAGTVRYCKEIGIAVPQKNIPPEWKG